MVTNDEDRKLLPVDVDILKLDIRLNNLMQQTNRVHSIMLIVLAIDLVKWVWPEDVGVYILSPPPPNSISPDKTLY